MKIVVTGASGNVGTSVCPALAADDRVEAIVGLARRVPALELSKLRWQQADVTRSDLVEIFRGADVVVHLAWLIQPSRDRATLRATNVDWTRRVIEAVERADVPGLVYASSVGAYSSGPKDRAVDESWPTEGIETSFYSRDKAETERMLDAFEERRPDIRVARLRPALIFKRQAATGIRRLFLGPFVPRFLLGADRVPVVPRIERLRFQCVHTDDVAEAYRLATLGDARGAFNVAADPVLDADVLAEALGARTMPVAAAILRGAAAATWRVRLQPTPPGWVDLALGVPVMSSERARSELGWSPRVASTDALRELLDGLRDGAGIGTPPLDPRSSGRLRANELRTGVGARGY